MKGNSTPLTNRINQYLYTTSPNNNRTYFLSAHEIYINKDQIQGHKTNLDKSKIIQIIQSLFFDYSSKSELEINEREKRI